MAEHQVTFRRAGTTIAVRDDQVVLDVARQGGVGLRLIGCAYGECGACKVRLVSGEVAPYDGYGITAREKAAGRLLLCRARPRSDLIVDEEQ